MVTFKYGTSSDRHYATAFSTFGLHECPNCGVKLNIDLEKYNRRAFWFHFLAIPFMMIMIILLNKILKILFNILFFPVLTIIFLCCFIISMRCKLVVRLSEKLGRNQYDPILI